MLPALCFSFISGRRWWSAHDDTLSLFDQQYENTKEAETMSVFYLSLVSLSAAGGVLFPTFPATPLQKRQDRRLWMDEWQTKIS
jgi:hypothetical protein